MLPKFTPGVTKYRLEHNGQPVAPYRFRLVDAAADAIEKGFARPDKQGRVCLDEAAEIVVFKNGSRSHATQFASVP